MTQSKIDKLNQEFSEDRNPLINDVSNILDPNDDDLSLLSAEKLHDKILQENRGREVEDEIYLIAEILKLSYQEYIEQGEGYTLLDKDESVIKFFEDKYKATLEQFFKPTNDEEKKTPELQKSVSTPMNTSDKSEFIDELIKEFWSDNETLFIDWVQFLECRKVLAKDVSKDLYTFLHIMESVDESLKELRTTVKKNLKKLPEKDIGNPVIFADLIFLITYRSIINMNAQRILRMK